MQNSEIKIYRNPNGISPIEVKIENDTVWLNQYQLEEVFETNRSTINKHILNVYRSGELSEETTCAKIAQVQKEGNRSVKRNVKFYNLDVIIAVGYRVNSKKGTEFRIWANLILKEYLMEGFAINEEKLRRQNTQLNELKKTVKILSNTLDYKLLSNDESRGLLKIISEYSYALEILDQYDYQTLEINNTSEKSYFHLTYDEAIAQIQKAKNSYGNSPLFGKEKDDSFKSSIASIYQTFDGKDLYPSIEEKSANLIYFIVKNHSFIDGNKRIAAFIFLYFLEKNRILFSKDGNKRIADNALVALTLMIAVSKPEEKDTMVKVIVNLINSNNL